MPVGTSGRVRSWSLSPSAFHNTDSREAFRYAIRWFLISSMDNSLGVPHLPRLGDHGRHIRLRAPVAHASIRVP